MAPTSVQASTELPDRRPDQVFAVLADPFRHAECDATGMVGAPVTEEPLLRVGQVFTMHMSYDDGRDVEHYVTDNHVTAYVPDRTIAWATAAQGGEPFGWTWRYDLEPVGGGTRVTLTYEWAQTRPDVAERFGVPITDADGLADSLVGLDAACRRTRS